MIQKDRGECREPFRSRRGPIKGFYRIPYASFPREVSLEGVGGGREIIIVALSASVIKRSPSGSCCKSTMLGRRAALPRRQFAERTHYTEILTRLYYRLFTFLNRLLTRRKQDSSPSHNVSERYDTNNRAVPRSRLAPLPSRLLAKFPSPPRPESSYREFIIRSARRRPPASTVILHGGAFARENEGESIASRRDFLLGTHVAGCERRFGPDKSSGPR